MRHKFTPEEDEQLKKLVVLYGIKAWTIIAELMGNLSARQCRERYCNYLQPCLTNKEWTLEEENLLSSNVLEYGHRWTKICAFFKGRSDVNIKNHWAMMQRHEKKIWKYKNTLKFVEISFEPMNSSNKMSTCS